MLRTTSLKRLCEKYIIFGVFLLYAGLTFAGVIFHEPWRDEAQAWLIARDLDIISIFQQMPYEGSPALWHLLLVPLAKAGLPYFSESLLHLIIMLTATFIVMKYAPFPLITRLLLPFTYFFLFEYSLIARNYAPGILLLLLIAFVYSKRFEKPRTYALLVFLLFQTNIHSFFPALALFLGFIYENTRITKQKKFSVTNVGAMLLVFFGMLIAFFQSYPPPDQIYSGIFPFFMPRAITEAISMALLPFKGQYPLTLPVAITVLLIFIIHLISNPLPLLYFLFSLAGLAYIFVFHHHGALRHQGLILIIFLFTLWISRDRRNGPEWAATIVTRKNVFWILNLILLLSVIPGITSLIRDYRVPYSGAKNMAIYINQNQLQSKTIAAAEAPACSAILPWLDRKKFYYLDLHEKGSFITWDQHYQKAINIPFSNLLVRAGKFLNAYPGSLLLLNHKIPDTEDHPFTLLHKTRENVIHEEERFYLYANPHLDSAGRRTHF